MRAAIREEIERRAKLPPRKPRLGRPPRTDIDRDRIMSLAAAGCGVREIAATIRCSPQTLYDRFSQEMQVGRERGTGMIKRVAFEMAVVKKDSAMIRFLMERIVLKEDRKPDSQIEVATTMDELMKLSTKEIEERLAKLQAMADAPADEILS